MKDIILKVRDKSFTSKLLKMTLQSLRQGGVGIGISTKKDLVLCGSRLFQSALNTNFIEQLKEEWEDLKKKEK
jgi:hypothetical protein